MEIGFLGAGSMAAAIVPHLVKAGHRVGVWNRDQAKAAAIEGVAVLATPAEAFAREIVFSMLSDDAAVRAVVVDSGALASARAGLVHVSMSTLSPAFIDELEAAHRAGGLGFVAAPVFGVPAAAAQAKLNIVVAGEGAAVDRVRPLLELLGQKLWPVGEKPSLANVAKVAGNLMIAQAIESMAEAAALAEGHGLAAQALLDIVTNTLFACPSYQRYGGFIASGRHEPGFKLVLGLKDVDLALAAARDAGVELPAGGVVRGHLQQAVERGLGGRDWSALATVVRGKPEAG